MFCRRWPLKVLPFSAAFMLKLFREPEERREDMRSDIQKIIEENRMCVMATVGRDAPHCSLMSYASGRDGREIYMATFKDTKKYHNLIANPNVSLLIDTRVVDAEGTPRALTVTGIVEAVDNDNSIEEIRETLLRKHPALKDFFNHPDVRIIVVRPTTLQLLDNVTDVYFEELRQPKR